MEKISEVKEIKENRAVLFFDNSTNTGWCLSVNNEPVQSGVFSLDYLSTNGVRFVVFSRFIENKVKSSLTWLARYRKNAELAIGYERGFLRGQAVSEFLLGLNAFTIKVACDYQLECYDVSPLTLKKYITGNHLASKGDIVKAVNKRFPEIHKLTVDDHHIADAIAGTVFIFETIFNNPSTSSG